MDKEKYMEYNPNLLSKSSDLHDTVSFIGSYLLDSLR